MNQLVSNQRFENRHIGPREEDVNEMLKILGFQSLDEMAEKIVPKSIRSQHKFQFPSGKSEFCAINGIKKMMSKNKIFKSFIGMGFHDCITPSVIQRKVFENPNWYTAYTPYQPEISQGRLEALLNFQTMICDLTGMQISNSSLLDEGSAAAEAMSMAYDLSKNKSNQFVVSPEMHPHIIEVLKTRAEPLGLEIIVTDPNLYKGSCFACFVQYPNTYGKVEDYKALAENIHQKAAYLVASVDLLALTVLIPPGEWGADIVVGNAQRFGVPLGNGGPHPAFLATKDEYKRSMPGRLIGLSIDSQNKPALRLALQTREQHIRREKATSNICTAQVLLANMASMYAVYHGPLGLKNMALRIHQLTCVLAKGLFKLGFEVSESDFFDTLVIKAKNEVEMSLFLKQAEAFQHNYRLINKTTVSLSLNETSCPGVVEQIWTVFNSGTKVNFSFPEILKELDFKKGFISSKFNRTSSFLKQAVFNSYQSETDMMRYIQSLENKDLSLTHSMIPLGSCTMKLNPSSSLIPISWPEVNRLHPFAPKEQKQGYEELILDFENKLCELTGFAGVSFQPNAGSQGEYAGLLVIRKYHQSRGQAHRNICLIPASAHGTNPASAVMAGMTVVVVSCDNNGNVDVEDLKKKALQYKDQLAALMITYPSTHGVFEESFAEICKIIHDQGGQVYMDGANMNALVGLCRPADMGADVSHMNLHKTFAIPHGGGGPGVGPIGVASHLKAFLPKTEIVLVGSAGSGASAGSAGSGSSAASSSQAISAVASAPYGSASILPISWMYLTMMGFEGLRKATLVSILNANYIANQLNSSYPVLYRGREGFVAHECILDLRPLKKTSGIDVNDVAKRLMDYGFHSPTMSFPVAGTLMVEPTESESKAELDRFISAMKAIRKEIQDVEDKKIDSENNPLKMAPHTVEMVVSTEWNHPYTREVGAFPLAWIKANKFWPAVGRVDNAYGDRHLVCSCPPLESY